MLYSCSRTPMKTHFVVLTPKHQKKNTLAGMCWEVQTRPGKNTLAIQAPYSRQLCFLSPSRALAQRLSTAHGTAYSSKVHVGRKYSLSVSQIQNFLSPVPDARLRSIPLSAGHLLRGELHRGGFSFLPLRCSSVLFLTKAGLACRQRLCVAGLEEQDKMRRNKIKLVCDGF